MKVFNPSFNIVIASKPKRNINPKTKTNKTSRRCLAIVAKINNEFKAIVNYDKDVVDVTDSFTLKNEVLVLPFTERSLSLKDKERVWLKEKDKLGHSVCIIRDCTKTNVNPGIKDQYDVFKEDILIVGRIVKENGIMYFDYEDLISYNYKSENKLINVKIDDSKPLFSK